VPPPLASKLARGCARAEVLQGGSGFFIQLGRGDERICFRLSNTLHYFVLELLPAFAQV